MVNTNIRATHTCIHTLNHFLQEFFTYFVILNNQITKVIKTQLKLSYQLYKEKKVWIIGFTISKFIDLSEEI